MIKNLVLFKYRDEFVDSWRVDQDSIENASLNASVDATAGRNRKAVESLAKVARAEGIRLQEFRMGQHVFSVKCEFQVPQLLASGESPFVPVDFDLWLRERTSLVVAFDAGRKLARVGTTLLGYGTTENPSAIAGIKLDKHHFLELRDWILSNSLGKIQRVTLMDVERDREVEFKQIMLRSDDLESSKLYRDLLDRSTGIANLAFVTPPLAATHRQLSCRLTRWGGTTLYTPNLLDSEVSELLDAFERIL